jgi:hypothetical protein
MLLKCILKKYFLKHVIGGKIGGRIEGMGIRGRRLSSC